jgi:hypothetical protein
MIKKNLNLIIQRITLLNGIELSNCTALLGESQKDWYENKLQKFILA